MMVHIDVIEIADNSLTPLHAQVSCNCSYCKAVKTIIMEPILLEFIIHSGALRHDHCTEFHTTYIMLAW